jgi:large subunit ribosomal protein L25
MEKIQLKVLNRDLKTTTPAKLRKQGMVPAVLYGYKMENTALAVPSGEFERVLKKAGESTIVELVTDDGKTHPVLIHDVQHHVITSSPIHVDFFAVNMLVKLKANIPLEFEGEANAVKAMGGTLVKVLNEVEVECLPVDLPHNIIVDISVLQDFDKTIHVKDLKVSDKVQIITDEDETVAMAQPPRDVEAELAVPVTEDVAAVIEASTEKKEGEDEAAEAEEKPAKE